MKEIIIIGLTLLMLTNIYGQINDNLIAGTITQFKIVNKSNLNLKLETIDWEGDTDITFLNSKDSTEMAPMFLHLNGETYTVKISLNYQNYLIEFSATQIPDTWTITNEGLKKWLSTQTATLVERQKIKHRFYNELVFLI